MSVTALLWLILWQSTWGNNVAWLESLAFTAIAVWPFRHHLSRGLVRHFHRHYTEHVARLNEGIKATRFSKAEWKPISVNYFNGGCHPRYLILHIMQGTFTGTDAWFRNPAAKVSAHFGVSKKGELRQWVDTANTAWAEADGNGVAISVECEGFSGQSLTDAQISALSELAAWCHTAHGIPLESTNDPSSKGSGLGWHGMGGVPWGDHPDCPGLPIREQRGAILKAAKRHLGPVLTHGETAGKRSLIDWAKEIAKCEISTLLRVTVENSPDKKFASNLAAYLNKGDLTALMPAGIKLFYYLPED